MARLAVLALTAAFATAAAPAWDIGGTWKGVPGTLTLVQSGSSLRGTFAMTFVCTARYAATGSISGSTVRLTLRLVTAPAGPARCASSQTLRGTVSRTGTAMSLVLANAQQVSPPMPYLGRAKKLPGK